MRVRKWLLDWRRAIHGTVGEFNPTNEDWGSYTERLQQYFTANEVAEGKQKAILLSSYLLPHYKPYSSC